MSDICEHLRKIYSQKQLVFYYNNLLDFRFAKESIVFTQDSIIYTIKIPILNPIEFILFQRFATIDNKNQTEVITNPWTLPTSLLKLYANKCQHIYEQNYLCDQITTKENKPEFLTIQSPMVLTYKLPVDQILISSNYPIAVQNEKNKATIIGTHLLQGNGILIQGHKLDENFGEMNSTNIIIPVIIKDHQLKFEPLTKLILPDSIGIISSSSQVESCLYILATILLLLLLLVVIAYIWKLYKEYQQKDQQKNNNQQKSQYKEHQCIQLKNEDVLPIGPGGVI